MSARRVLTLAGLALLLAAAALGHRETELVHECFLHCHGEPAIELSRTGWPLVFATRTSHEGPSHATFAVLPLVLDLLVVWGLLCVVAIAQHARELQRLRSRALPRAHAVRSTDA